ncbi:MAG TPA: nuclear transport factor 2 family protein, partial [Flavobacterium sp.]|nr:nuclear transport factor 2 family protein [Flavobacterium sp.]
WQIFVDGGIASAWTPYEFYFEDKFSHCGVNSFQLILEDGKWKITGITDSRRRTACYNEEKEKLIIDSLMNSWHQAAARGDEEAFFGAMTEDGVYIGTDATERWTRDELKSWSARFFERDTAWSFIPVSRNIHIGDDGKTAWLDELLDTWMGTCRSTAILTHEEGRWAIKYYHLSIAVPNEKVDGYLELIKE